VKSSKVVWSTETRLGDALLGLKWLPQLNCQMQVTDCAKPQSPAGSLGWQETGAYCVYYITGPNE